MSDQCFAWHKGIQTSMGLTYSEMAFSGTWEILLKDVKDLKPGEVIVDITIEVRFAAREKE